MGVNVGSYTATLTIPEFKGVMQFDENESVNTDMRYAVDAKNIDIRDGALLPFMIPVYRINPDTIGKFRSATVFNRRITRDTSFPDAKKLIVAGCEDGYMYALTPGKNNWKQIANVRDMQTHKFPSPYHSFVSYEREVTDQGTSEIRDMLYFSSAENALVGMDGSTFVTFSFPTMPDYKFSALARHGDRVWGAGCKEAPDIIAYSRPYNPHNWQQDTSIPEDGGGIIRQPSFDGEEFTALKSFGNTLLAFKESHVWRVTGITPDEFTFQEQYGGGTIFPNTIATNQEQLYFLTDEGVCVYDGVTVRPFQQYALRSLFRDLNIRGVLTDNTGAINYYEPVGVLWDDKYIVCFPGGTHNDNYYHIVYDFKEQAWSYGEGVMPAESLLVLDRELYTLQYTTFPGQTDVRTGLYKWYGSIENKPSYTTYDENPNTGAPPLDDPKFAGFTWTSPWSDMGAKDVLKHDYKVRFWIQVHTDLMETGDNAGKLKLDVTIETERGSKTRTITFAQDADEEIKMRFHISGKKMRLKLRATDADGNEQMHCWCKILGGMQINADTSPE